jgi:hypothetical protein
MVSGLGFRSIGAGERNTGWKLFLDGTTVDDFRFL